LGGFLFRISYARAYRVTPGDRVAFMMMDIMSAEFVFCGIYRYKSGVVW
jgi:hypothetical protein